jgi:hypothetical protein
MGRFWSGRGPRQHCLPLLILCAVLFRDEAEMRSHRLQKTADSACSPYWPSWCHLWPQEGRQRLGLASVHLGLVLRQNRRGCILFVIAVHANLVSKVVLLGSHPLASPNSGSLSTTQILNGLPPTNDFARIHTFNLHKEMFVMFVKARVNCCLCKTANC